LKDGRLRGGRFWMHKLGLAILVLSDVLETSASIGIGKIERFGCKW